MPPAVQGCALRSMRRPRAAAPLRRLCPCPGCALGKAKRRCWLCLCWLCRAVGVLVRRQLIGRCFGARLIMCSRVAARWLSGMAGAPVLMRSLLSGQRRVVSRCGSGALTGRAGVLLPVRCGRAPCSRLLLHLVAAGWWLSPAGAARLPLLRLPAPWVSVSGCAGDCPRRCPTGLLRLPGYRLPCSATAHRMERGARPIQSAEQCRLP